MARPVPRSLLAAVLLVAAPAAQTATITVNTTNDSGVGNCTLSEAVAAANTDAAVDGCSAGSGDDVVDLTGLSGTIELSAPLAVGENLRIAGPGARSLRISGASLVGSSQMIRNDDANLEIEDVTIADKQGEGIFASCLIPCQGQMTLDRVRVTNCVANVSPPIPFPEDGQGGAMSTNCTEADVTIRDSLFDQNDVTGAGALGGAIWWAGRDLTIVNTTFSGNTSQGSGGALWAAPFAAGGGEVKLRNVTFSDNSAASGAAVLAAGSPITIENSVLAQSSSGGNCAVTGGTLTSAGYNLSDDASCAFAGTGDLNDVPSNLDPLADNGGPTDTHRFAVGSALEDAGNPAGCLDENGAILAADQRGSPRPAGPACDIGAVEGGGAGCEPQPLAGCAVAGKAQLRIANSADPAKRAVAWSWRKGGPVTLPELGDPSTETFYALCVYDAVDGAAELALALVVDPGAAWKAAGTKGWKYKDKTGAADGVQSVALKVGAAGKAGAQVSARGQSLPDLVPNDASELFDQDSAVTVQLMNGDGACWTSEFTALGTKRNDALGFEAKAP